MHAISASWSFASGDLRMGTVLCTSIVRDAELTTLCHSCGLCCDGSLFGRVPLLPAELPLARKHRLHVVPSGSAMEQPCAALALDAEESRICTAYEDRPAACRAFDCVLLARHRSEGGPLAPRLEAVRRVRALLAAVEASGLRTGSNFDELVERIAADFARA
jgi:uncharacterized protein